MTQNFDTDDMLELEKQREDEVLDDDYWYQRYLSEREDLAKEKYYKKKYGDEF